jgi:hypothetical protein
VFSDGDDVAKTALSFERHAATDRSRFERSRPCSSREEVAELRMPGLVV